MLHETSFPKEDGLTYGVDLKTGKVFEPREMNLWKDTLNDDSIREKGYSMAVRGEDGVYLRLDREHYNITDRTVPFLVSEKTEHGRSSYRLDGSSTAYRNSCYYMNDKYLYLYIEELWGYGKYLAFADFDEEEFAEFFSVDTDL